MNNFAFIDGQNLILGTTLSNEPWKVDLYRFRRYLRDKYDVTKAYYFLGCIDTKNQDLYDMIQDAGFILVFRSYDFDAISHKKGNVDTDIVFTMMRIFHELSNVDKFFLVSGDGDYYKTIDYLNKQGKLGKVLLPSHKNASSLYRRLNNSNYDYLDNPDLKRKIVYKKKRK
ncbi:MAG: NYN domain-containing protein [Candidatus Saccharibacteria bacterium]|nr:NYN domain-containing protein [Candidatus Saccharibacteria bacterium]